MGRRSGYRVAREDYDWLIVMLLSILVLVVLGVVGLGDVSAQEATIPPPTVTAVPTCTPFPVDRIVHPLETVAVVQGEIVAGLEGLGVTLGGISETVGVQATVVAESGVVVSDTLEVVSVAAVGSSRQVNGVVIGAFVLVALTVAAVVGIWLR